MHIQHFYWSSTYCVLLSRNVIADFVLTTFFNKNYIYISLVGP